jgi:hypothetical protein
MSLDHITLVKRVAFVLIASLILSCSYPSSYLKEAPHQPAASTQSEEESADPNQAFTDPKVCGGCHPRQYDQWVGSMHHYAQATYPMELVNDFLLKETGKTIGPFCIQCHTPIGTINGEPYGLPNKDRSAISMSGVSCVVCHSIKESHGASQAFFGLKPGNTVYGPHGKGTEGDPPFGRMTAHQAEQKDIFKSSELCQNCHELMVSNGLRLQETYSEWKNSPWAKEGVTCQQCHMSSTPGRVSKPERGVIAEVGGVDLPERPLSDHSFLGPDQHWDENYPFRSMDGKAADPRTKRRNVDLQKRLSEKRTALMRGAALLHVTAPSSLSPKGKIRLDVQVENKFAGHHFPSGFPWRQAWIEIKMMDAKETVFFQSGDVDENGDLRNGFSHAVKEGRVAIDHALVNLSPQILVRGFKGNDVEVAFPLAEEDAPSPTVFQAVSPQTVYNGAENARIVKRSIPARESRAFHYAIPLSEKVAGPISYTVRLLYRPYPPHYLDYFVKYYPDQKELLKQMKDRLQIYEVDSISGKIDVR